MFVKNPISVFILNTNFLTLLLVDITIDNVIDTDGISFIVGHFRFCTQILLGYIALRKNTFSNSDFRSPV